MEFLKKIIRPYRIAHFQRKSKLRFESALKKTKSFKIVVGSSGKFEKGWIPSEWYFLNLLDEKNWHHYFSENSIENILAEHVWEHLTLEEGTKAASVCYKFLKKSGRLRIAVPDGYHSNNQYIESVKVNGTGRGADDHKVLYNCELLRTMLESVGFSTNLIEYFDKSREFNTEGWDFKDGFIARSVKNNVVDPDGISNYTSLIIDAFKD